MHSISMAPASAWPGILDLSEHRVFLDVGGGSGAHSITAAAKWPELEAIVLDLPFVCEVAEELVAAAGLDGRIRTHPADMWRAPFPPADVHFYSQIFHDHPLSRCRTLARKSFDSLSPGGRIVVHEMLLDEDETGPFAVATIGVAMLLLTQGQQFTAPQLHALLEEVGFEGVEVVPTFGHWQLVTGRKPW
jgi:precorrin-6B methylase 2